MGMKDFPFIFTYGQLLILLYIMSRTWSSRKWLMGLMFRLTYLERSQRVRCSDLLVLVFDAIWNETIIRLAKALHFFM